jgi:hypothetical protein
MKKEKVERLRERIVAFYILSLTTEYKTCILICIRKFLGDLSYMYFAGSERY